MHEGAGVFQKVHFITDHEAEPSNNGAYKLLVNSERNAFIELGLKQEAEAPNDALMFCELRGQREEVIPERDQQGAEAS